MWFIPTNVGLSSLHIIQQQWSVDIMWHVVRHSSAHVVLIAGLRKKKRDWGNDRSCVYTCEGLIPPLGGNPIVVVTWVTIYEHLLWHQTLPIEFPTNHVGEIVTLVGLGNPDNLGSQINRFSYTLLLCFFPGNKAATL